MILAVLLALVQEPAAPPAPPPPPPPVAQWADLPLLRLDHRPDMAALSAFVRGEVQAGRCKIAGDEVTVDLIVRIGEDGLPRRVIPEAIDCPTVEQYAAGLVIRLARGSADEPNGAGWYHVALTFDW